MKLTFGDNLKKVRNKLDLSRLELAKLLEIDYNTVCRYERNEMLPALCKVYEYAEKLKCDVKELV